MSIDLAIPGDPAAIHTLAERLDAMKDGLVDLDLELAYIASDAQMYMVGQAGNAFQRTTTAVRNHSNSVPSYLGDAADVFHAYATRLERGVRDFDGYLEQCRERDLVVYGKKVLQPTSSAQVCSVPGEDPEWDAHMSRVRTYNDLAERVGTWWGDLEAWIAEHMAPLIADVEGFASLGATFDELEFGNSDLVSTALTAADERVRRDLADYRGVAQQMQQDADDFTRGLRSGHPGVKAAAEAANPRAIREGVADLLDDIHGVSRVSKLIPIAGNVIEIISVADDIASGESGSSAIVEAGAGIGGGAAVGAGIAAAGGPVGWVIGGVVVGGIAIGSAAKWGWESWVPLDVRESIDGWLYDGTTAWQGPQLAR
ncbi:hypothetical protein [Leucobacter musarum]|uniref:hypothetical protein n=1 Tax=Leucobacter musarum TaxID=1930747 RepID=UPI0006A7B4D5|nr:hypothetical protein [Leucobacter musarum]